MVLKSGPRLSLKESALSIRLIVPLAAVSMALAACEAPQQNSSFDRMILNSSAVIPAGVPCDRIDERFRDTVSGCNVIVQDSPQKQLTREELVDLNVKFSSEVVNFVNFDFDQALLRSDAKKTLDRQAEWISQYPDLHFSVFGHTDLVGSLDYNFDLAKRRADAVVAYLISKGASRDQLESVVSFGETQPLVQTTRREEANRRAVTEVSGYLNLKQISQVSISCGMLSASYAASYAQCVDVKNDVPVVPPMEPSPPTVVEAEYGYDTDANAETSDARGRASITDDGDGNRVAEASGETGPEDDPRTSVSVSSETVNTSSEESDTVSASASGRAGDVSVTREPDGSVTFGSN